MFKVVKKEIEVAGKKIILETGKIARQADSTVIATYGGTTVMCNVVAAKEANPDMDFFPLTVNYQEKYYSVGKIPGGFFKREARPTEKETLVSRLMIGQLDLYFIKILKMRLKLLVLYYRMIKKMTQML